MAYKELISNPYYASIIIFITQIAFLYLRTLNVIYTSEMRMWPTIWTGNGVSFFWLISMSIGMNSMLNENWMPVISFLIGGTIGTYWAVTQESKNNLKFKKNEQS